MTLPGEVDVLIVGFGAAGASAAIAAHDAGAEVAVVEKTAAGGGNCRHSGGFQFEVDGPEAVEHLDAMCFGMTDREVLRAFADGLLDVPGFLASLGGQTAPVEVGRVRRDAALVAALPRRRPRALPAAGSIWGHLTEHGGGLTDAIVFGRVAGSGAAAAA